MENLRNKKSLNITDPPTNYYDNSIYQSYILYALDQCHFHCKAKAHSNVHRKALGHCQANKPQVFAICCQVIFPFGYFSQHHFHFVKQIERNIFVARAADKSGKSRLMIFFFALRQQRKKSLRSNSKLSSQLNWKGL